MELGFVWRSSGTLGAFLSVACSSGSGMRSAPDALEETPATVVAVADESPDSNEDQDAVPLLAELEVSKLAYQPLGVAPFVVIENDQTLDTLLETVAVPRDDVTIDFDDYVGVLAYLGMEPAIWKFIAGVEARDTNGRVEVEFIVGAPEDCDRPASISYPFALARIERRDLPYAFSIRERVPECE